MRRFLKAKTDWKNNRTTCVRDEYIREMSRTGTPEVRTITTQWHGSLPLKSRIGEPGRLTEHRCGNSGK